MLIVPQAGVVGMGVAAAANLCEDGPLMSMTGITDDTLVALERLATWEVKGKTGFLRGPYLCFELRRFRWEALVSEAWGGERDVDARARRRELLLETLATVEFEAPFSPAEAASKIEASNPFTLQGLWGYFAFNCIADEPKAPLEAVAAETYETLIQASENAGRLPPAAVVKARQKWRTWLTRANGDVRKLFRTAAARSLPGPYATLIGAHLGPKYSQRASLQFEAAKAIGVLQLLLGRDVAAIRGVSEEDLTAWCVDAEAWRASRGGGGDGAGVALLERLLGLLNDLQHVWPASQLTALGSAVWESVGDLEEGFNDFVLRSGVTWRPTRGNGNGALWEAALEQAQAGTRRAADLFAYGASDSSDTPDEPLTPLQEVLTRRAGAAGSAAMTSHATPGEWKGRNLRWAADITQADAELISVTVTSPERTVEGATLFVGGRLATLDAAGRGEIDIDDGAATVPSALPPVLIVFADGSFDDGVVAVDSVSQLSV